MRTLVESVLPSSATTLPTMSSVNAATTVFPSRVQPFGELGRAEQPLFLAGVEHEDDRWRRARADSACEKTRASSTTAEVPEPSSSAPGAVLVESHAPVGVAADARCRSARRHDDAAVSRPGSMPSTLTMFTRGLSGCRGTAIDRGVVLDAQAPAAVATGRLELRVQTSGARRRCRA